MADHWVDETLRVKKAKAEKAPRARAAGSRWINPNRPVLYEVY